MFRPPIDILGNAVKSVRNRVYWPVVCTTGFALIYAAWAQLSLQYLHRFRFPYRDFVYVTEELDKLPALSALTPWKGPAIDQHQVIYPNIFYILDRLYFGASGDLLYPLIYGFTVLSAVVVIVPAVSSLRTGPRNSASAMIAALFATCVIYWFCSGYNWENLTFQIQLCETGCIAFMILGFWAASQVSMHGGHTNTVARDTLWAGLSAASCHIAALSWGAGMVCWPVLLAHAVLYRWRRTPFIVASVFGIVTIAIFSYGYLKGQDYQSSVFYQSFVTGISRPFRLLYFILNVFAWPPSLAIGDWLPQRIARLLALAVALPIVAFALIAMARYHFHKIASGNSIRSQTAFFTMLVAAAVCSAALTGAFRSGALVGWGQSRYGVFSALFWLGVVGWSICISPRAAPRTVIALAGISVMMAFAPWRYYEFDIRSREQGLYQAGTLATFGLRTDELPSLNGTDQLQLQVWRKPRAKAPSFAEREPFGWYGRSIASLGPVPARGGCAGEVENTIAVKNNLKVFVVDGWVTGGTASKALRWVLVVNGKGVVVGGGKPGLPSHDLATRFGNSQSRSSDMGNARFSVAAINSDAKQFSLWGILGNGEPCEAAISKERHDRLCEKNCGFDPWYGIGLPS